MIESAPGPPPARPDARILAFVFAALLVCAAWSALALRSVLGEGQAGILYEPARVAWSDSARVNRDAGRLSMLDPDGAATAAGITPADRIVAIEGIPIDSTESLRALATQSPPGRVLRYSVERDSVRRIVPVRLAGFLDAFDDRVLAALYGLIGLLYLGLGLVVYLRRPGHARARVFLALCTIFAGSFVLAITLAGPVYLRGIQAGFAFNASLASLLAGVSVAGLLSIGIFVHFALVFPRTRPSLVANPRLPVWIHALPLALVLAAAAPAGIAIVVRPLPAALRIAIAVALVAIGVGLAMRAGRDWMRRPWLGMSALVVGWSGVALLLLRVVARETTIGRIGATVVFLIPILVLGLWLVGGTLLTIGLLAKSYRESDTEGRQQLKWPFAAVAINLVGGLLGAITGIVWGGRGDVAGSVSWQRLFEILSLLTSLAIPIAFAVAILKYRLFDLGVVIRRTAIYGIVTFVLAALYIAVVAGMGNVIATTFQATGSWPAVVGTLAVAMLFVPARNWAQRLVDRSFFRVRYDASASLARLGRALTAAPDPATRARAAVSELVGSLRLRGAAAWLRAPDGRTATRAASLGDGAAAPIEWTADLERALAAGDLVPLDLLPGGTGDRVRAGRGDFVAPLVRDGRPTGFLAVGARLSDETLDVDDRAFLHAVAGQLALALAPVADLTRERELDEARRIQATLLPQRLPTIPGATLAAHWQPAREVAGDAYDVFELPGARWAVWAADVSGKGMPAALLMSNLQSMVKAFAASDPDPAELCARVNRAFAGNLAPGRFITLFYARYEPSSGTLRYANAGHNPPLRLAKDGTATWLEHGGLLVGAFPEAEYEAGEVALAPGDRVVLFTDGVTEAQHRDGDLFGEERLLASVVAAAEEEAEGVKARLLADVRAFCADEFDDDATILVLGVD